MKNGFGLYSVLMFLVIALLAGLLAGCSGLPQRTLGGRPTPTATLLPTATQTPGPTETPPPPENCAYVWSTRSLPEVTDAVNRSLRDAGMPEVAGQASAYGEDCLDPQTNTVVDFRTMQTDFYFNITMPDVTDMEAMGEWVEKILRVLEGLPAEQVPGPNLGYVGITFDAGDETANLWFPRARAQELIKQNTTGASLYEALAANP